MTNPFFDDRWIAELHRKKHKEIFDFKDFFRRRHEATAKVRESLEHHITNYKVSFGLDTLASRFDEKSSMDKRGFAEVVFFGQNSDYGLTLRLCNDERLDIGVLIYERAAKAWPDKSVLGEITDLVICSQDQIEIARYRLEDDAVATGYSNFIWRLTTPNNAWQYAQRYISNNHRFYAKLRTEEAAMMPSLRSESGNRMTNFGK